MTPIDVLTPPPQPATTPAGPRPAEGGHIQAPATQPAGPRQDPGAQRASGVAFQQVDPGFVYQVDVYDGTSWGKIGEIWAPTNQAEVWGLYAVWSTYSPGPAALYLSVLGSSSTYASLTAFKAAIKSQDPLQTPIYWEAKLI